jgi:hypothetical protein
MWDELGISPCDDPKAIRRAYAARLKKLDPDRDPAAFARLREALELALAEAEGAAEPIQPSRAPQPEAEDAHELWLNDDHARQPPANHPAQNDAPPIEDPPTSPGAADAALQWHELAASDRALLNELESALDRRDATAAMNLYYRAAATGAVALHAAPPLLDRLFALSLDEPMVERTAFRELARSSGWDKPAPEPATASELRQRVLARLAAETWYDSLCAAAERPRGTTRKQAKLARLMLGRIGRYRTPRIDRAALRTRLDEFRSHQIWLRDRIDPAWAEKLEKRWHRREIALLAVLFLWLTAMLLNGIRLVIMEGIEGTLSLGVIAATPFALAIMLWFLKLLATELRRLLWPIADTPGSEPTAESDPPDQQAPDHPEPSGPDLPDDPELADQGMPDDVEGRVRWLERQAELAHKAMYDDPEARLRWLEQQAELAYEAMYDAPFGSAGHYSDAKEFLHDAIALARQLDHVATAERLSQRLDAIKAVYRSQFSN